MSEFPHEFLGIIDEFRDVISTHRPVGVKLVDRNVLSHGGVHVWRVLDANGNSFDIYADYKGRGFWIVDAETGLDVSGPVRVAWENKELVIAAVAVISALREKAQRRKEA